MPTDVIRLDDAALRAWPLSWPDEDGDKETRGRVVIVAGSRQLPGAGILAAQAALRAGAGKVLLATAESAALAVGIAVPELRVVPWPETNSGGLDPNCASLLDECAGEAGALLIGPGLEDEEASIRLARELMRRFARVPTILDATALGAVADRPGDQAGPVLVTPHAGEMAHLSGLGKEAIVDDAMSVARQAARRWNAIVALKGAITFIARPDGRTWMHDAGNVGLATAGSGDVLAGLVAGLAARGAPLEQAVAWGVGLHARAGMRLAKRIGGMGYLARELSGEVPALMDGLG